MWGMSRSWECFLLWCTCCLSIFPETVTALSTCLRSGDCLSGFYCHTGNDFCVSCDKCSDARGNLRLCQKECTGVPVIHESNQKVLVDDPSTSNKPTVAIVVAATAVFLVAVIVTAILLHRRFRKRMNLARPIEETGNVEPSQMGPTTTHPLPECASPDESPLLVATNHQC